MSFDKGAAFAELERLADLYFNEEPEVSDAEFDALKRHYEVMTGKKYKHVGAPARRNKVHLPYYMGSVDAKFKGANAQKAFDQWAKKYPGPWIVALKLDGNAGQYINGRKMYSKGDGVEGEDISSIVPYLNLPKQKCVVRGELLLKKKDFEEYACNHRDDGSKRKLTNSRSAGLGILKNANRDEGIEKMNYIAFQIQNEVLSTFDHYQKLKELGFSIPTYWIYDQLIVKELTALLEQWREESLYDIDGLVISPAYTAYEFPMDSNPKHLIAFKVDTYEVVTVTEIVWNITPKAQLVPNVHYEPTLLNGHKCTQATGHNAKFILNEKIGPGSQVLVCKSGDITPQVVRGVTQCEELQLPEIDYEWDATKTHFLVREPDESSDYKIQQMVHFAKQMKIDGLQKTRVTTLYNNGIDTTAKLLTATEDDLIQCERVGVKLAFKIRQSIDEKTTNADLATVMCASNVFGKGLGVIKLGEIVKAYPNILDYCDAEEGVVTEMLLQLGGFVKMAAVFEDRLPLFEEWLAEHPSIRFKESEEVTKEGDTLKGEVIVFTGISAAERVKLERIVVQTGGDYKKAVSGRTTLLVAKDLDNVSGKAQKLKNGRLISLDDFLEEYELEW